MSSRLPAGIVTLSASTVGSAEPQALQKLFCVPGVREPKGADLIAAGEPNEGRVGGEQIGRVRAAGVLLAAGRNGTEKKPSIFPVTSNVTALHRQEPESVRVMVSLLLADAGGVQASGMALASLPCW